MAVKTLIRGGIPKIVHWQPMPPEAPCHDYVVHTGHGLHHFPTLKQAVEFADRDRCPLLAALPFSQED